MAKRQRAGSGGMGAGRYPLDARRINRGMAKAAAAAWRLCARRLIISIGGWRNRRRKKRRHGGIKWRGAEGSAGHRNGESQQINISLRPSIMAKRWLSRMAHGDISESEYGRRQSLAAAISVSVRRHRRRRAGGRQAKAGTAGEKYGERRHGIAKAEITAAAEKRCAIAAS